MTKIFFIDLFCGAGGTTSGIHRARRNNKVIAEVIACVNHDPNAIKSHYLNYPKVKHFTEDIRTLDITPLIELVKKIRRDNPGCIIALWASLECTNHSKAKGGMSRDADSRTLAEHLFRYVLGLSPDYIWIENVVEFEDWGPLEIKVKASHPKKDIHYPHCPLNIVRDKKNKKVVSIGPVWVPVKEEMGIYYDAWLEKMKGYGYHFDSRHLNSADYGAYQTRKRYFGQFAKKGMPIAWPLPTHAKNGFKDRRGRKPVITVTGERVPVLKKWKAVKEVLDLWDTGKSIFGRDEDLSDKTYERIYHGLIKFVAGGKDELAGFLMRYYSGTPEHRSHSLNDPAGTVTTENRMAYATIHFLSKYFSGKPQGKNISIDGPAGTITTFNGQAQVSVQFLSKYYTANPASENIPLTGPAGAIKTKDIHSLASVQFIHQRNSGEPNAKTFSLERPARALTKTGGNQELVTSKFIASYYGNGQNVRSLEEPCNTIPTKDRVAVITPYIMRNFSGGGTAQSIENPSGSVTTVNKSNLVTPQWLLDTQFDNNGRSLENPGPTVTANRKVFYLMSHQYTSVGTGIDQPCPTLIAKMEKKPNYLVEIEGGHLGIEIFPTDTKFMVLIKEFMALYGIVDIKMRMLKIIELLRIQGFVNKQYKKYQLFGTQADQKKFIGNAVEVNQAQALVQASYFAILDWQKRKKQAA